ncbi:AfsR/SARP family transcriptional regulator [Saccharothrix obliqua]|uniref:AfsR/SARP family transcriptional regulator n=1 Tax=Saccharothrix obliqua TaxID=2861747 RepID=UPI001C5F0F76|nr:BTAD domain-containing putative transcriptional regulator [Saccharothrix obliqua]MBW4722176.1 tetratricopeptide repeat protein [Saccharothrix obliqua]
MAVEFRVLGPVEAEVDGRPVDLGHARQRWVLAVLLVAANQWLSADQLLDRAWGDRIPYGGRDSLYGYLSRLRRALRATGEADIVRRSGGYELVVDPDAVDVHRFHRLVADAHATDDEGAAALLGRALELWRGEPCTGLDTPWIDAVRAELERQRLAAELDHNDLRLRLGRHAGLLTGLAALTTTHPLDERLAGQFMLALYRNGRQADALDHYRRLRARLAEDLGTDPGPDLQRLHQRILAADPALADPAAEAGRPPATPRQLPAAPGMFTGRHAELAQLDHAPTTTASTVLISAIGGAGGIGKTWLALAWAHRNLHRFPDGQLFVDLHGFSPTGRPIDPADALRGFLTALGAAPDGLPPDRDGLAARYRSLVAGRRMLVVLDNAATAEQVAPLLPGSPTCTVLVTGRTTLPSLIDRHGARHLSLDVLTPAEARALLAARLGEARIDAESAVTDELLGLCGRHPLALTITARHAATRPHVPLAEIAAELRESGLDMLDHDTDPTASLPAVLSWSLRWLTDRQRTVFALLGIAPGPDIDLPAATALTGEPEVDTRKALRALEDHFLLDRHAHGRYAMHDLVRAYAATTAHDHLTEPVRRAALERVVDHYLHTAHAADRLLDPHRQPITIGPPAAGARPLALPDPPSALAWLNTHHPHLLSAQHTADATGRYPAVWHLAWALTTFHMRRGHRHDALAVWQAAVDAAEHLPDPATRALAHRRLGHAYSELELHDQAVEHLHRALALTEHHQDTNQQAQTHHYLARIRERQGDDRQALEHARYALDLFRTLDEPVAEAVALNAVGWYAAHVGDYDTARDHCLAALALARHHHATNSEAAVLDSLGFIDHHTGHHHRAVDHYQQALTLYRALGDTTDAAHTLDRLGHPHVALGRGDRARAVWQEALELYREQGRDADAERVRRQLDDLVAG